MTIIKKNQRYKQIYNKEKFEVLIKSHTKRNQDCIDLWLNSIKTLKAANIHIPQASVKQREEIQPNSFYNGNTTLIHKLAENTRKQNKTK